ncbi:hypothetical protein HX004_13220 [Myroides sp. 1354]|uniref:hypothetical protein n=1 Tax=unclassified Myroides TaxID=2642485 RepID=UPI0025791DF7|nr:MULTISPECIES: hypothetical protein [unclassified Myroides]MDM1045731.1 hypothetical protein [Myroides sp. R163-1]MDM1056733.1 hypothetical protein [Myroides sp. 1354]MDM1070526.1 hypothetical protein [Myroides sp. 1372]
MKNAFTRPFETIQERKLFGIGIAILLVASTVAYFTNARFDGVLDVHFTSTIKWYQPFIDNCINTLCLAILLFLLSRFLPTKARFIDILNVALICRIPLYFAPLTNIGNINQETSEFLIDNISNSSALSELPVFNIAVLVLGGLVALLALVLMGFLLYRGYKNATNSKQVSHHVLLLVVVILAEMTSKLLVYLY